MAAPQRFWMVKGAGPTQYPHDSRASAEYEADRLARLNPGQCFYVLEAVTAHVRVDVQRIVLTEAESIDDEDRPF